MTAKIQVRRDLASNWTTANPTLAAGEFGYETDTGLIKIGDGSTAWASLNPFYSNYTTYTPTVSQGTNADISYTGTYVKYSRSGKTVSLNINMTLTEAGDDNNNIVITLPVSASTSGLIVGTGYYWDASGNQYPANVYLASTTTITLQRTDTSTSTNNAAIGVDPNIATANNDIIKFTCVYEAA